MTRKYVTKYYSIPSSKKAETINETRIETRNGIFNFYAPNKTNQELFEMYNVTTLAEVEAKINAEVREQKAKDKELLETF